MYTRACLKNENSISHLENQTRFHLLNTEYWIDIVSDSGWAEEKEFNKMKLSTPVNEGWLYSKDKNSIKLFASYDRDEDGSLTFGDRTMIPLSCVKKMIKIS